MVSISPVPRFSISCFVSNFVPFTKAKEKYNEQFIAIWFFLKDGMQETKEIVLSQIY